MAARAIVPSVVCFGGDMVSEYVSAGESRIGSKVEGSVGSGDLLSPDRSSRLVEQSKRSAWGGMPALGWFAPRQDFDRPGADERRGRPPASSGSSWRSCRRSGARRPRRTPQMRVIVFLPVACYHAKCEMICRRVIGVTRVTSETHRCCYPRRNETHFQRERLAPAAAAERRGPSRCLPRLPAP